MKNGALCISLDFEKYWGMHDLIHTKDINNTFENVSSIVDQLLDLFNTYNIHCTWATVGLLNFKSIDELNEATKGLSVDYDLAGYNPYPISKHNLSQYKPEHFLSKKEIVKIQSTQGQELASHTFSHYYCLEKGQTMNQFKQDLSLFKKHVGQVKSIIFPRNQVSDNYLNLCFENGITAYRGHQKQWFWKSKTHQAETIFQKIIRTADAYMKMSKHRFTDWHNLDISENKPVNIPANRFLKSYRYGKLIEGLKLSRIKKEMLFAAKTNRIYHLWWHPHNFSTHTHQNFEQLEALLKYHSTLKKKYHFKSLNMNEITSCLG